MLKSIYWYEHRVLNEGARESTKEAEGLCSSIGGTTKWNNQYHQSSMKLNHQLKKTHGGTHVWANDTTSVILLLIEYSSIYFCRYRDYLVSDSWYSKYCLGGFSSVYYLLTQIRYLCFPALQTLCHQCSSYLVGKIPFQAMILLRSTVASCIKESRRL